MNRIQFTEDRDKLKAPRFTTIRSYRAEKEEYYRSLVGQTLLVWRKTGRSIWNGHKVGTATLLRVDVVEPRRLPAELLWTDVARDGTVDNAWLRRLMEMDRALLLEFENHTGLMAAKWGPSTGGAEGGRPA